MIGLVTYPVKVRYEWELKHIIPFQYTVISKCTALEEVNLWLAVFGSVRGIFDLFFIISYCFLASSIFTLIVTIIQGVM